MGTPGAVDGTVPRRSKIALGAMFGLAALGIRLLLFLRPDLASPVERTPTWLRDFWGTIALVTGPSTG